MHLAKASKAILIEMVELNQQSGKDFSIRNHFVFETLQLRKRRTGDRGRERERQRKR